MCLKAGKNFQGLEHQSDFCFKNTQKPRLSFFTHSFTATHTRSSRVIFVLMLAFNPLGRGKFHTFNLAFYEGL